MKILAPASGIESAICVIEAGAEELYLGADDEIFKLYSFTGRGKISYNGSQILKKMDELKETVLYAQSRGVKVNFLGNVPFHHNGLYNNKEMDKYYLNYLEKGLEIGVDSIVIGDIGLLALAHRTFPTAELHASIYFRTINSEQLRFLKQFGVTRTALSYQVSMEDIRSLCGKEIMGIETVGYLGCSFFNGGCGFLHDFGEGVLDEFNPGVACKCFFDVKDGHKQSILKIFDFEASCSICTLFELEKAGVEALKIVGRGRDVKQIAEVIQIYKQFLSGYRQGKLFAEMQDQLPLWWKKLSCSKKSCKYMKHTPSYSYMIGG